MSLPESPPREQGNGYLYLEVAGLRTRLYREGAGRPILVLHGWGASIEAVQSIVRALSPLASVYAVDLPGFGETALPPAAWGTEEYAAFVRELLDELGLDRTALVGHSNGGRIAIRLAVEAPERVESLVLVDSAGIRARRRALSWKRALAKGGRLAGRVAGPPGRRVQAAIVARIASEDYLNAGPMRPTLVRLVNEDLTPLLPQVRAPALLIWGAKDTATPLADGQLMERLIPDAGLVTFEHAGHYSYADEPVAFARVVRHFFAGAGQA